MAKKRAVKKPDAVAMIFSVLQSAKARTIKRITKQLERMSPQDVAMLERLLGRR